MMIDCKNPGCDIKFTRRSERGPEPDYCSNACRQAAYRSRVDSKTLRLSSEEARQTSEALAAVVTLLGEDAWVPARGLSEPTLRALRDRIRSLV